MGEGVVDELEAVEVEEQDRAARAGITLGALQDLIDPVDEERAVGQAGEGVVQGVVLQAQLRDAPVGDVRQRAGHPGRTAIGAANGQAPGHHPPPGAVGVAHPVLGLQVGRAPVEVRLDRRAQAQDVAGVHEIEPDRGVAVGGDLVATRPAEDRMPARREVDRAALQAPVPDAVVGGSHGERVTLLGEGEIADGSRVRDRVADRPFQARGIELVLDQVVGHAQRRGLDVDLVGRLAGEHEHRGVLSVGEALAHELQARVLAEAVIDEVHVMAPLTDGVQPFDVPGPPVDGEAGPFLAGEHVARDEVVVLVVFDEQDRDRRSRVKRHLGLRRATRRSRTSTASRCASPRPGRRR